MPRQRSRHELPDRNEILAFIRESPGRVGKREIARAFGVKGSDRVALKELLRDLAAEGVVEGGRRRFVDPGKVPEFAVVAVTAIDGDGEAWAEPVDWRGPSPTPRVLLVSEATRARAPGLGERVLARLRPAGEGFLYGHVIRHLPREEGRLVGIYRRGPGGARITPTNRRIGGDFAVAGGSVAAAEGDLVIAVPEANRRLGLPEARVVEVLGSPRQPRVASLIAIHSHGLPTEFSADALHDAATARPVTGLGARTDFRHVPLVTIDDEDARDFDDAVWADADTDPANPGGWRAIVAIADVAHYVRAGGALDRAARERGNSAYFPDRVVPMLPEPLSNDLCSLKPGQDRPCLVVEMSIGARGELRRHRFQRGLMRSTARLTYRTLQTAADGGAPVAVATDALYGVFGVLREARRRRGALDIDLPERRVFLDEEGRVNAIVPRARFDSHRLIEELMIAANVAAAETLEGHRRPAMYRVHDQPTMAKVEALREVLASFGLKLRKGARIEPKDFNHILAATAGTPHAPIVHEAILRSQAQAVYDPANIGHFGLALRRYCHFTSPIRRYADLVVHRSLIEALGLGHDGLTPTETSDLPATGLHLTVTERRATRAERDAIDRYVAEFLADRVGATFSGRVTGVGRFGLFVRLDETGAEGLIPASRIPGGPFRPDEGGFVLAGHGVTYHIGEAAEVTLVEVEPVTGGLRFELAGGEARKGRRDGPPRRRRRV
ncbi:MAG: ribonuclease R [Alphaproteobacteria bacterium]|nr:ribonuclease R [Alphaproteobacteria bacterium]